MSQVQQLLESAASDWKNMQSDAAKLAAKGGKAAAKALSAKRDD